jgi:hypothetical protein
MIHRTPQKISKRCRMLNQAENALFEYFWGSKIFGNSELTFWCIQIDKTYCTRGHKKYPDMPFGEGVADRQMLE